MITVDEQIVVPSPPETVWRVLSDPDEVMQCIAGAEIGARHDDGSFDARLSVKFGGLRVSFAARATLELDESERRGLLSARGADRQGATRVRSNSTFRVAPAAAGAGCNVAIGGEVDLSGKLASVIEAGAGVVVTRMTKEFAQSLTARCVELEAPAADGALPAGQPVLAGTAPAGIFPEPEWATPVASVARTPSADPAGGISPGASVATRPTVWARLLAWLTGRAPARAGGSR